MRFETKKFISRLMRGFDRLINRQPIFEPVRLITDREVSIGQRRVAHLSCQEGVCIFTKKTFEVSRLQ